MSVLVICVCSVHLLLLSPRRIGFNAPAEAGLYVWHCHLLEHEDNEMMVPFCFGSPTYPDPRRPGQLMCPGRQSVDVDVDADALAALTG